MSDPAASSFQVIALPPIGAYVAAPLVKRGEWIATLAVHSSLPRRWKDWEIEIVHETAERTWAAVEHARAYVRQVELRLSAERAAQQARALQSLTAALSEALSVTTVGEVITSATDLLGAKGTGVWLRRGDALELLAARSVSERSTTMYRQVPLEMLSPRGHRGRGSKHPHARFGMLYCGPWLSKIERGKNGPPFGPRQWSFARGASGNPSWISAPLAVRRRFRLQQDLRSKASASLARTARGVRGVAFPSVSFREPVHDRTL